MKHLELALTLLLLVVPAAISSPEPTDNGSTDNSVDGAGGKFHPSVPIIPKLAPQRAALPVGADAGDDAKVSTPPTAPAGSPTSTEPTSTEPRSTEPRSTGPATTEPPPSSLPSVLPPDLPARPPVPTPPQLSLPQPRAIRQRQPLSWRARAYELASIAAQSKTSNAIKASASYDSNYNDTIHALVKAIKQSGLKLEGTAGNAGQVAARMTDPALDRFIIVFVVQPVSLGKTGIIAGLMPDSKSFHQQLIQDVLTVTTNILASKELL